MDRRVLQNAVRNVLDGELLNRYLYLSTMERGELAKKIGTTPDIVSRPPPCPSTCPHPPRPLPSPTSLPTDPGRPVGDGPSHCPLLDPWVLPLCPPRFCTKHKEKHLFDLRRACGHCRPNSRPQSLQCPQVCLRPLMPWPWPAPQPAVGRALWSSCRGSLDLQVLVQPLGLGHEAQVDQDSDQEGSDPHRQGLQPGMGVSKGRRLVGGVGPGYPPFGPRAPTHLRATSNLNDSQMTLMWRRRLAP